MYKDNVTSYNNAKTHKDLVDGALAHVMEGRRWGQLFTKYMNKYAAFDNYDYDIQRVMRAMKTEDDSKVIKLKHRMVADNEELQRLSSEDKEKELKGKAKVIGHNLYTIGALRVWENEGIKLVRRIEIQDDKICPLCRIKNGELYEVDFLLGKDLPLIHDTHPHCRGSFIPVMGSITKHPGHTAEHEHVATLMMYGCVIEDIPVEYKPFMEKFLKKIAPLPFKVKFDKEVPYDYMMRGEKLIINPRSADHEDPREIIARCKARKVWPHHKAAFEREYGALMKLGLVHPNRASQSWPELFENTYTEFKLNQLDEPYEVLWCKANLAA